MQSKPTSVTTNAQLRKRIGIRLLSKAKIDKRIVGLSRNEASRDYKQCQENRRTHDSHDDLGPRCLRIGLSRSDPTERLNRSLSPVSRQPGKCRRCADSCCGSRIAVWRSRKSASGKLALALPLWPAIAY